MSIGDESRRSVFLVHGRDEAARKSLEALLRAFDLKVIPWRRAAAWAGGGAPYTGDIVAAGMSRAHAVVVLLTPDDVGHLRQAFVQEGDGPHERRPTGQPRMNVLFEAGMAMARDRERVVLVEVGAVRRMSDIDGVNVIRLDDTIARRRDLAERLEAAGLTVDMEMDDEAWRTAGTFARAPLSEEDLAPADTVVARPSAKGSDSAVPEVPPIRTGTDTPREGRSGKSAAYLLFWTLFLGRVRGDERGTWIRSRATRSDNWMILESRDGGAYSVSFGSGGRLRCEFYIDGGDADLNLSRLRALEARKREIEAAFGSPLAWEELPGKRACRIATYASGDVLDTSRHETYVEWFIDNATRLREVLGRHGL